MLPRRHAIYVAFEIAKIFVVTMIVFIEPIVLLGVVQKLFTDRIGLLAI